MLTYGQAPFFQVIVSKVLQHQPPFRVIQIGPEAVQGAVKADIRVVQQTTCSKPAAADGTQSAIDMDHVLNQDSSSLQYTQYLIQQLSSNGSSTW